MMIDTERIECLDREQNDLLERRRRCYAGRQTVMWWYLSCEIWRVVTTRFKLKGYPCTPAAENYRRARANYCEAFARETAEEARRVP
jgi:hypothetical protein